MNENVNVIEKALRLVVGVVNNVKRDVLGLDKTITTTEAHDRIVDKLIKVNKGS